MYTAAWSPACWEEVGVLGMDLPKTGPLPKGRGWRAQGGEYESESEFCWKVLAWYVPGVPSGVLGGMPASRWGPQCLRGYTHPPRILGDRSCSDLDGSLARPPGKSSTRACVRETLCHVGRGLLARSITYAARERHSLARPMHSPVHRRIPP